MIHTIVFWWLTMVTATCIAASNAVGAQDDQKRALIQQLYDCGAIKLQNTRTKNGQISPIYFDMRIVISHPGLLHHLAAVLHTMSTDCAVDVLCGVPYGAVPLATAVALYGKYPMIMHRKQAKAYGTQKLIEGVVIPGASCLVVEDVITTGSSILETIDVLEREGLAVHDVVVVIDREQGGVAHVRKQGYTVHALCTLSEVLSVLLAAELITHEQYATVKRWCSECAASAA